MPAVIVFGPGSPGEPGGRGAGPGESLRVSEDADAVARKLNQSKNGLVSFQVEKGNRTVWVNRDQVRMVRDVATKNTS
jgi:hypothetical protein